MRVGLVGVGTLVEVRRVGLTRVEVEVDRVAQRDTRALVERLVVRSQPVAHEPVDALGALEPVGVGLPVRDREQVVLAVLEVDLGPALPSCIGHENFKRDFTGASGLFSFELHKRLNDEELSTFIDHFELFTMAYSWGGFESLILCNQPEEIAKIARVLNVN